MKKEINEKNLENFIKKLSGAITKEEGIDPLEVWSEEQLESKPYR